MARKKCYFCGVELDKTNRSKEHVPPKMMFNAFQCDSITVPSCHEHNGSMSGQDQAFVAGFIKSLEAGNYLLTPNVQTAIAYESKKSTFATTNKTAQLKQLIRNPSKALASLPDVTYITYSPVDWVIKITAALVYDATGKYENSINWNEVAYFNPSFYSGRPTGMSEKDVFQLASGIEDKKSLWESLNWLNGWSASPIAYPADIYRFYVSFHKPILFKHVFYDNFTVYIGFEGDEGVRKRVGHHVLEVNGL